MEAIIEGLAQYGPLGLWTASTAVDELATTEKMRKQTSNVLLKRFAIIKIKSLKN